MKRLRYPSKDFSLAWRKMVEDKLEFEVDVKIDRFRKKSVKHWIDGAIPGRGPHRRFGSFWAIFCGDLSSCIATARVTEVYRVDYSEAASALRVTFHRK